MVAVSIGLLAEKSFTDEHAAAVLWRYHNRPEEELYDVEADPQEMRNLAADPEYAEFRPQMAFWRKRQGDFKQDLKNFRINRGTKRERNRNQLHLMFFKLKFDFIHS